MTEENQQSIFFDIDPHIHEREWNKAIKKIKAARIAIIGFALTCFVVFTYVYLYETADHSLLFYGSVFCGLLYLSRRRPFTAFVIALAICLGKLFYQLHEMIFVYNQLSMDYWATIFIKAVIALFIIRGISGTHSIKYMKKKSDNHLPLF